MEKFLKKFKLDKHHTMERFGVVFLLLVSALCFTIGVTFMKYCKDSKETLSAQPIYTTEFSTSRTGVTGTVENVYVNKDRTKTLLLLKFSDMENISVDANDYEIFLTGSSLSGGKTELKMRPSGCIYLFGNTGYMGIYLVDNRGFQSQIVNLIVRNNKELKSANETEEQPVYEDSSFEKFDQFAVYFNPGASGAVVSDVLNQKDAITPENVYNEMVAVPAEKECKDTLNDDLKQMLELIGRIADCRSTRLVNDGVIVPDMPEEVQGDSITEKDGLYYFTTKKEVPGSYGLIPWQTGSIKDGGYINKLLNGMSFAEFFAKKQKEQQEDDSVRSWTTTEWYRKDGSRIIIGDTTLEYEKLIQDDIEKYKDYLSQYYSLKHKYLVEDMYNLLLLDANTQGMNTLYTVNQNPKSIYIY